MNENPRPFLKWAGGKGQVLPRLLAELPSSFGNYHEPFLGGGALFFALCRQGRMAGRKIYLGDSNEELICTYKAIRDNVEGVIRKLKPLKYDEDQFYEVRAMNPATMLPTVKAARMIYLNRTCFNGLYRVNKKGRFNVSWGRYTDPLICDEPNLRAVSAVLAGVDFMDTSFEAAASKAKSGDFVYLDPPYLPASATANFTNFTRFGFSINDHEWLLQMFQNMAGIGVFVLLSNSDNEWTRERYSFNNRIMEVRARRSINSKGTSRGKVKELLIASYPEDKQSALAL